MAKAARIEMTAALKSITRRSDGKFLFKVEDRSSSIGYRFLLSPAKALKIANGDSEFPRGVNLRLSGRRPIASSTGAKLHAYNFITFVKIHAVDGHDVQSWAERHNSPTVDPEVLSGSRKRIDEAEEEAMRHRAPPDPPPTFASPEEAYEKAMYIVRRQVRLKEPKLSKSDIWALRDALNMLKESAGL